MCEVDIGNPKYTTFTKLVQVRNFYSPFEFKGFSTWWERDTILLCWLLLHRQLSTQPTRSARSAQRRLASPRSESQLSRSDAGTQLTAFSQISAHASGTWCHSNPLVTVPIWDFYFDNSEWHILSARAWTPALTLHLTNTCAKRKILSLTKLKGKIYKTKSLHHYITSEYMAQISGSLIVTNYDSSRASTSAALSIRVTSSPILKSLNWQRSLTSGPG